MLVHTVLGEWCPHMSVYCHVYFYGTYPLELSGTHIAPDRGSGAPHIDNNAKH